MGNLDIYKAVAGHESHDIRKLYKFFTYAPRRKLPSLAHLLARSSTLTLASHSLLPPSLLPGSIHPSVLHPVDVPVCGVVRGANKAPAANLKAP